MNDKRKPQTEDKYVLRFPGDMRQRLKDIAAENGRSLNAEIIHRLEQSFSPRHLVLPPAEATDAVDLNDSENEKYLRRIIKNIVVHGVVDIHALTLLRKLPVPDDLGTDDIFVGAEPIDLSDADSSEKSD